MASALRLWCVACGRGTVVERKPDGDFDLPDCLTCGPTKWNTADQPNDRQYPYELNHNDKRFLSSIKIGWQESEDE